MKGLFAVNEIDEFAAELTSCPFRIIIEALLPGYFAQGAFHVVVNAVHLNASVVEYSEHILSVDC